MTVARGRNTLARTFIMTAVIVHLAGHGVSAQTRPGPAALLGTWRGTSSCTVHPSPCNDESVVYRISAGSRSDSAAVDARKVVNGQEEGMGILACRFVAPNQLRCTIPRGEWRFSVRADSLTGELLLADSTRYRTVRAGRSR